MQQTKQRSLLDWIVGKPVSWLSWVWAALAVVWIVFAVVEPSGFHAVMAITWSVLAVLKFLSAGLARRQERARAAVEAHPGMH